MASLIHISYDYIFPKVSFVFLLLLSISFQTLGQKKEKVSFRDKEDGKVDLSDWIIDAHGFIPLPTLITEPAFGGIGGSLGLAFLQPVENNPPNVTFATVGLTSNGTWFAGALHTHYLPKSGIRLRGALAYSNVNIALYKTLPMVGERKFDFNFKMIPVYLNAIKRLGSSDFYAGASYLFMNTKVALQDNGELPSFVAEKEINSNVSSLGPVLEFDSRDNTFTPNSGFKVNLTVNFSESWLGSDYSYTRANLASYSYWSLTPAWVLGWRAEYQAAYSDPPFFLLPSIDMRGIPIGRYQNNNTLLTEFENRFDIGSRFSIVAFGGVGKAFKDLNQIGDETLAYGVGTGYRYLIARKFGIRMGMDIAKSNDAWGYYLILGSAWLR